MTEEPPRGSYAIKYVYMYVCTPRVFISGYSNTGKKFSIAFIK